MTEWALQERLTRIWVLDGLTIGDERYLLAAWEVMVPSWRINDAAKYWSEPSIDFLFLDRAGGLLAVELKPSITGIKPGWRALCQVTHRAVRLVQTFAPDLLEAAHATAYSGFHGRVATERGRMPLWERHQMFFDLAQPARPIGAPVARAVAATAFGPGWAGVLAEFNSLSWPELIVRLGELGELVDSVSTREPRRVAALKEMVGCLDGEVRSIQV